MRCDHLFWGKYHFVFSVFQTPTMLLTADIFIFQPSNFKGINTYIRFQK